MHAATRRNLELTETLRGEAAPTLLSAIDTTVTAMGARLLRHWLHHPLRDREAVGLRVEAIRALSENAGLRASLTTLLKSCADLERIAGRCALRSARPRDLSAMRDTLALLPEVQALLGLDSPAVAAIRNACTPLPALHELLCQAILQEPAVVLREGGVIADGYDADLDELRAGRGAGAAASASRRRLGGRSAPTRGGGQG